MGPPADRSRRRAAGILAQIAVAARAMGVPPDAVWVGFGGPIDAGRGVVVKSHQVGGCDGLPLADWSRRELAVEAVPVRNDSDAAAPGEARVGAGEGLSPLLDVNSGLVVDGQIYRGSGLAAREVGHLRAASRELTAPPLGEQDCVLIVTDHAAYDWPWVVEHSALVVDSRNATAAVADHRDRIVRA